MNNTATSPVTPSANTSKRIRPQQHPSLHDALSALGHRPRDRVSVNTKSAGGHFRSRMVTVASLDGWTPPADCDVWFGVLPVARSVSGGRGRDADVTRVRALWADLDAKQGCLGSLAECHAVADLLAEWLGCAPTARIETGHGLQPIWRVRSPRAQPNGIAEHRREPLAGELWNREQWRAAQARWGGLVRLAVDQIHPGATADPVFDLARVLRCPGSVNNKQKDRPVAVRTALNTAAPGVTRQRLVNVLAAHRVVVPLPAPAMAAVPTAPAEAVEWVNSLPGSEVVWHEMSPALQVLVLYPRLLELFSKGTDDETSAHSLMNKRVLAVVLTAGEGNAGAVLALGMVRAAYLETMELRRAGTIPGEARSQSVALSDFHRAVRGAVSKARGRQTVSPLRDSDGAIRLNIARVPG